MGVFYSFMETACIHGLMYEQNVRIDRYENIPECGMWKHDIPQHFEGPTNTQDENWQTREGIAWGQLVHKFAVDQRNRTYKLQHESLLVE